MISRAGRTASAVTAAVTTTAGGHLLGTGAAPPVAGVLLVAAVLVLPAWWLTGDERGWERLAGGQLAAQLVGHALFVACAGDPAAHAGHGTLGPELVLGVHLVSAAVAGAWLRSGERRAVAAARRAVVLLRQLVARLLRTWRSTGPLVVPPRVDGSARRVVAACLQHSIVHRGPPAVCC